MEFWKIILIIIVLLFSTYFLSSIQMRAWLDTIEQFMNKKQKSYEQKEKK